jgi:hypothetical protein
MLTSKLGIIGQYGIVENLQGNYNGMDIRPRDANSVHHIGIRNYKLRGTGQFQVGNGIMLGGDPTNLIHDVVVFSCDISYVGQLDAPSEDDSTCFPMPVNHYNTWVLDSLGHHSGGDGEQSGHGGGVHNLYIGRNIFYNNRENGVDLKNVTDVVVSENDIHGHYNVSSSYGEDIVLHDYTRNVFILFNTIYDADFGIQADGVYAVTVIGNTIYNIEGPFEWGYPASPYRFGVCIMWYNAGPVTVVGNTLSDCILGIGTDLDGIGAVITNNIITDINSARTGYALSLQGSAGMAASIIKNNIFHQATGNALFYWGSTTYNGLAAFQAASSKGQNCLETDPLLVNVANNNFHLQPDSPAIDSGEPQLIESISDAYYSTFGVDIRKDIEERIRPLDGNGNGSAEWDIGAYEYNATEGALFSQPMHISVFSKVWNWIKGIFLL